MAYMNQTMVIELRKALKMSQEEFARKLGVAWGTVNRWEAGKCKPTPTSIHLMEVVAEKYGIRIRGRLNRPELHEKFKAKKK